MKVNTLLYREGKPLPVICEVTKVIRVTNELFDKVIQNPEKPWTFLKQNKSRMRLLDQSVQCLLVCPRNKNSGVVIYDEGEGGAKYISRVTDSQTYIDDEVKVVNWYGPEMIEDQGNKKDKEYQNTIYWERQVLSWSEIKKMMIEHILWQYDEPGGEYADFTGKCLTGENLSNYNLTGVQFNDTDLTRVNMSKSIFSSCQFVHAIMDCSDLSNGEFVRSNFIYTSFINADLSHGYFKKAVFDSVNARGACFKEANLAGTSFRYADLTDANFEGADLTDVDFTGAILKGVITNGREEIQLNSEIEQAL
ncbi:pentapeptide repeat-containing protein [Diplocloster hominis]|uniref:pentapeptide repeat-containing protein n=1 Tax=Diplocloster hominis TaxID=3079010 RepID=UPI0031B9AF87